MKKNKIKCITSALSLSMLMGISQPMVTWALFTDTVTIKGNQTISTGTVDVEIREVDEQSSVESGEVCKTFKIESNGTLDQNIGIKVSGTLFENHENIELHYSTGKNDGKKELTSETIIPTRKLKSGNTTSFKIHVSLKDDDNLKKEMSTEALSLRVDVDAKQIGNVTKGFIDKCSIDTRINIDTLETKPEEDKEPESEENPATKPDEDKSPESEENPTTKPESEENPAIKPDEDVEPDPEENTATKPEEDKEPESEENPPTKPEEDIVPDPEETPATKPEEDVEPDPEENPATKPEEEVTPENKKE